MRSRRDIFDRYILFFICVQTESLVYKCRSAVRDAPQQRFKPFSGGRSEPQPEARELSQNSGTSTVRCMPRWPRRTSLLSTLGMFSQGFLKRYQVVKKKFIEVNGQSWLPFLIGGTADGAFIVLEFCECRFLRKPQMKKKKKCKLYAQKKKKIDWRWCLYTLPRTLELSFKAIKCKVKLNVTPRLFTFDIASELQCMTGSRRINRINRHPCGQCEVQHPIQTFSTSAIPTNRHLGFSWSFS